MQHVAASVTECAEIIMRQNSDNDVDIARVVATALLFNLDNEKTDVHFLLPHKMMQESTQTCRELFEFLIRRKWATLLEDKQLEVSKSANKIEFVHQRDQWIFTLGPRSEGSALWWRLKFIADPLGDCSICHERGPNVRTGCGHMFHRSCLGRWVESSHNHDCPNCRAPLFTGVRLVRRQDDSDSD